MIIISLKFDFMISLLCQMTSDTNLTACVFLCMLFQRLETVVVFCYHVYFFRGFIYRW